MSVNALLTHPICLTLQTDEITDNILDAADRLLLTDREVLEKSNVDSDTSSTFLRNLDELAVYITSLPTTLQKKFC